MIKKRLIGVVTVRNGWAVQSFGYRRYLPLGRPECLVQNLDRWGADEILVQVIDRTRRGLGVDLDLLDRLGTLGLTTPLIYGGGIACADDAIRAIQSGADRIVVDQALCRVPTEVRRMSYLVGAQALVAGIPIDFQASPLRYDYLTKQLMPFSIPLLDLIADRVVSEIMLTDWRNDGGVTDLDPCQLADLPWPETPLILFGGFIDASRSRRFLDCPSVAAVAVGNRLSYGEHAYQQYKRAIGGDWLRHPLYVGRASLVGS